ncbi:hypothetical protein [Eubacterium ruminantium]|uniref:Uncharacterized protein n=1 Tax=Eubacterium ruminantium TaxID=42322 RepID=A0A1T4KAA0_9FIRM|nr:hypothetical protein [Eubacterium ruminantium]SCW67807.1 hypothetical protein SAMN05660484_02466 [Eubacterium ruminantium]SDN40429.1 hypothetical protein SAMN04490370_12117 [Eubacterium ruminantium]SJZ39245.1 hypothetical protein SAMN02745110_00290 [Eubacterium ruminantium]
MVRIEKIKIKNNIIECVLFPEDNKDGFILKYNPETREKDYQLPKGYEHCDVHVTMACVYLRNNYKKNLPESKVVIWY